jgi:tRNA nucleotidyltransferase (CCA-adding enzyme)
MDNIIIVESGSFMETFRIELPEDVKTIIETIEKNGLEAYAVGGCVRDSLLGRTPDDWDITTQAVPNQIKTFFKRTIDTGIKHGTVTVLFDKTGYEVTTYRIDGEYKDGRHPETVEFAVNLRDDLKRRDFTINAMAYNDQLGLVDEFDGKKDLAAKLIRCVGNPTERFTEDALRMMRAIRFSAQLGFQIHEDTYKAIVRLAPSIKQVSMERIQVELIKTIMSDHPDYVKLYDETGLLRETIPLLHQVLCGKYARNALCMVRHAKKEPILRLAALFNTVPYEQVRDTLKALKMDNHTVDMVTNLVKYAKDTVEENEPAVREAALKYSQELMSLRMDHERAVIATSEEVLGIVMKAKKQHLAIIERMYNEIINRGDCISIADLDITGNDLMEYGLKGPKIGKTLNELLHIVIENPKLNDKATLIALIEHLD